MARRFTCCRGLPALCLPMTTCPSKPHPFAERVGCRASFDPPATLACFFLRGRLRHEGGLQAHQGLDRREPSPGPSVQERTSADADPAARVFDMPQQPACIELLGGIPAQEYQPVPADP